MAARRVLVTGGSRGIGRALVLAFAGAGDHVLATGRDAAALAALHTESQALPGTVIPAIADVRDRLALQAALRDAWADAPLEVIVCNAGLSAKTPIDGPAAVDAAWMTQMATNLDGTWQTLRAALPRVTGPGRILAVASDLGRMGADGFSAYAASKHALLGLVRSLSLELAPRRITVNAVCPGWVDTDMAQESFAEMAAAYDLPLADLIAAETEALPLQRLLQAEEVAAMAVFLASPAAAGITGQAWGLDAGTTPFA